MHLLRMILSEEKQLLAHHLLFGRRSNGVIELAVLIQSCNRHAIRANKPSDANVCRAVCGYRTKYLVYEITGGNIE